MIAKYPRFKRRTVMGTEENIPDNRIPLSIDVPDNYYFICISKAQRTMHPRLTHWFATAQGQQYLRNYMRGKI